MIQKAQKQNAEEVIELLALALDHFVYRLSGVQEREEALKILQDFYLQENNRLSYQNIYVYQENEEILGVMCLYDGEKIQSLDAPILKHLQNLGCEWEIFAECEGDYYLDSIAVSQKARGKGIAKQLILQAVQVARENGKKLSLIVEDTNPKAKKLYETMGFVSVKKKEFYGHLYDYMLKD